MYRVFLIVLTAILLGGCQNFFLSPYDPVLDKGIMEFKEQFNAFVKGAGELGGKPEGTYEASLKAYSALDAKIDALIDRAASASEGKGCKLEQKLYEKIEKILQENIPADLKPDGQKKDGSAAGCNEKLFVLVKEQLPRIRRIHSETDKCGQLSCLRPATAASIIKIANQSIDAAAIVEAAKKN
jgi:hypothetical protein